MSLFQFGFERRKSAPVQWQGLERPVTEEEKEEFEEEFRRRTEIRRSSKDIESSKEPVNTHADLVLRKQS